MLRNSDEEEKNINKILILFFGIIIFLLLIEVSILVFGYLTADQVECSFWGCSFEKTNTFQNDSIIIRANRKCFYNGYEINCSDEKLNLPIVETSGNFDKEPIFKNEY